MRPRLALAFAAGCALVLVALAARGTSPVPYGEREAGAGVTVTVPTKIGADVRDVDVGDGSAVGGSLVAVMLVVVSMALVFLAGLLYSLRGSWRGRHRGVGVVVDADDFSGAEGHGALAEGARRALADLRPNTAGPPGDAVIAAWLRLEEAAADSGTAREQHQTPTEFTGGLLTRHRVDEDATGTLRRLYQRARFGRVEVTDDDARRAATALETIVRDLG